eukprot:TRINITY_DN41189_c0_g1_i1.p1 TRINITY_DN41189_c0_g1~~TRINITY_DN41189_c0_g1_i1.p1  ORF type:complete len:318 (+),score=23.06 TRINITY_DN41189_c0_g1_i1:175-1128(+)
MCIRDSNTPLVVIGFRSFVSGSVFDVYTWATDLLSVLDSTTLSRLPSTIQTILTKAANYHQGGSSHSSNHPPHKPESPPYLLLYCERDDVIVAGTLLDVIGSGRTQIIGAQLGPIVTQQLCTPEEVMLQCCEPISKLVEQQRHFISVSIGTEGGGGGAFVRSPSAVGDNESELALMRQSTSTGSEQHQLRGASGFQGVPAEEELVERCVSKHIIWGNASTTRYVDSVVDDIPESVTKLKAAVDAYTVSYTHLRAHETPEHLVCRLLLEKKKNPIIRRPRSSDIVRQTRGFPITSYLCLLYTSTRQRHSLASLLPTST